MKKTAPLCLFFLIGSGWATPDNAEMRNRAVTQAREVLNVRQSLLAHIQARYPQIKVESGPGALSFFMPPSLLFDNEGTVLSSSGEAVMGVLRDLATTYRSLYVSLRYEKGQATGGALKNNTRRTVGLGAVVFRRWGVPPANIYLRVVPSSREGFRVEFRTQKPDPAPAEQELPSVMVHLREPVFKFGVNPLFPIDVSLLARAGIRKWSLRLINVDTGVAVKEYSGTSDPWVSLQWDGRDKNGGPVSAGEYQAFLTAVGYGRDPMTDSGGFIIKDPPARLPAPLPATTKPSSVRRPVAVPTAVARPKVDEAPETRRWAFVVRFGRDRSDLAGSAALEIRQLAATLKAFPNEKVVVEGFSDLSEKEARTLASQRAQVIKDQLVETHNIDSNRLVVRVQDPRPALEGENMQKTVTFFVGIEGK
jgi:outer membrane protein OmpA-like peptidoglycan-associated protein